MHLKYFEWKKRRQETATATTITVQQIKANWAGAETERFLASARSVFDDDGQTALARNLRQAFREMIQERGLRLWGTTQSIN